VLVQKEIYGFIVNRIMEAINREAFYLAEQGIAAPEDIDTAVEGGLNHPMGPFRLVDLVGIDLNYIAHAERFEETRDPADAPSPLIVEKYEKGDFGRKTGRGFYTY
jgi:3-hydroxybutyryl-CoA dehydrogenase